MTLTELTYKQKFQELEPWFFAIFSSIKKDLRDEHLKADKGFLKRNFPGKAPNKISVEELIAVYSKFIYAGSDPLAEFVVNRWLLRHLDIYNFFEEALSKNYEQFDQISQIDEHVAKPLLEATVAKFGAVDSYIFAILNSVAFPSHLMTELKDHARQTPTAP